MRRKDDMSLRLFLSLLLGASLKKDGLGIRVKRTTYNPSNKHETKEIDLPRDTSKLIKPSTANKFKDMRLA